MSSGRGIGYALDPLSADAAFPGAGDYIGLESGLILFSVQEIEGVLHVVNTTFPLPVYLGEDLTAYATGSGSTLPNYSEARYLFWGDRDTDPEGDCLDWPTSMSLGTDNEYESEYLEEASDLESTQGHAIDPCWYSGKARLAAQSKIKAGASISDLAPTSWGTTIRYGRACNLGPNDGIFHDGDYHYWVIRADATGCKAVKLDIPDSLTDAECERTMLQGGNLSDDDQIRMEAYLLSVLEPVADSEITVLSAAQIASVYDDDKVPLDHGWHYSRQVDDKTEAAIVVCHESPLATPGDYFSRSYRYQLAFTVTSSTVNAVLTEEEGGADWYPRPNMDWLYINDPQTGYPTWWNALADGYFTAQGTDAAFYCFYTADDELEVCRYTYFLDNGQQPFSNNEPNAACAPGLYHENVWKNAQVSEVKFDVNYLANLALGTVGHSSLYVGYSTLTWTWSGAEYACGCMELGTASCAGESCPDSSTFASLALSNARNCGYSEQLPNDCYQAFHTVGEGSAEGEISVLYGIDTQKHIFIPDDAEAIYATSYFSYGANSSRQYREGNNSSCLSASRWVSLTDGSQYSAPQYVRIGPHSSGQDCSNGGSWETGSWNYSTVNGAGDDAKANIVTAHGVVALDKTTPTDWDLRGQVTLQDTDLSFYMHAQVSFMHGDTVYRPTPTDLDVTGDYQADAGELTSKVKRFIGHA